MLSQKPAESIWIPTTYYKEPLRSALYACGNPDDANLANMILPTGKALGEIWPGGSLRHVLHKRP